MLVVTGRSIINKKGDGSQVKESTDSNTTLEDDEVKGKSEIWRTYGTQSLALLSPGTSIFIYYLLNIVTQLPTISIRLIIRSCIFLWQDCTFILLAKPLNTKVMQYTGDSLEVLHHNPILRRAVLREHETWCFAIFISVVKPVHIASFWYHITVRHTSRIPWDRGHDLKMIWPD